MNGVLNASESKTLNLHVNELFHIASGRTDIGTSTNYFSGSMASVMVFDEALNATEIQTLMAHQTSSATVSDFAANVPATQTNSGFYRLVVTDGGGCKKEAFVSVTPLVADAGTGSSMALCPGSTPSVKLGPSSVNPNFDYSWTGPGGFTSSQANPVVTQAVLPVVVFCQDVAPATIGLNNTPPNGYVYQWVPGTNLDDAQAYNPTFDPGNVTGGFPIGTINYTFTALRLSDGCIYEDQVTVSDTARALAQAGIYLPACGLNPTATIGAVETEGNYFEWKAVATTYPGGVAALTSHAKFSMDGSAANLGTNKFLEASIPDHSACYTVDYEIVGSYLPLQNGC